MGWPGSEWARSGVRQEMYASPEIERPRSRTGRAGPVWNCRSTWTPRRGVCARFDALDAADAWDAVVELRGGLQVPARLLPLARLLEVVIHHVDLDVGYEVTDIDAAAEWLLEWCAFRLRHREDFPKLELVSESGFTRGGHRRPADRGQWEQSALLGWLMSRTDGSAVGGAGDCSYRPSDGGHQPCRTGRGHRW